MKWDEHLTCTHPPLCIQAGVFQALRLYVYALRRFCGRSEGAATLCPPPLSGAGDIGLYWQDDLKYIP